METKLGKIIHFGHAFGHVDNYYDGIYHLDCYSIDEECSSVMVKDFRIGEDTLNLRLATEDEADMFKMALYFQTGYVIAEYERDTSWAVKMKPISAGDWIEDNNKNRGVVLSEQDDSFIIGYINIKNGISPVTVEPWNVYLKKLSLAGKKGCLATLESYGFGWDEANLMTYSMATRAESGKMYWYITDRFTIRATADYYTAKNTAHYKCGNYFLDIEQARYFLKGLQHLLEELPSHSQL